MENNLKHIENISEYLYNLKQFYFINFLGESRLRYIKFNIDDFNHQIKFSVDKKEVIRLNNNYNKRKEIVLKIREVKKSIRIENNLKRKYS
jgi:hypothetical protein